MPYPTLHQIEVFYTVARRRSFARAAEELYLSRPSVSLQVQHLEHFYGTPLFNRTSQGPELTECGAILYEAAENVFEHLQQAATAIDQAVFPEHRRLNVGATVELGIYHVPEVVAIFRRRYPGTIAHLVLTEQDKLERELLRQTVEIAIVGRQIESQHLVSEPLGPAEMVLLVHPKSRLAARSEVPASVLAEETFLMREPGSYTRKAVLEAMERGDLRFKRTVEVTSVEGLLRAVAEGRGVGFAPAAFCELERRQGQIATLNVTDVSLEVFFSLVWLRNQPLGEAAEAFAACCREVLSRPHATSA